MINKYITILLFMISCSMAHALPTMNVTIQVIDENNQPLKQAKSGIVLSHDRAKGQGSGTDTSHVYGISDNNGEVSIGGETLMPVTVYAKKDGYYGSGLRYDLREVSGLVGFRKWQPQNSTVKIVLKKKINPIPLHAIKLRPQVLPHLNTFIGFDLIEKDWVIPYGQGVSKDLLIKFTKHYANSRSDYNVEIEIKFPNDRDGLIEILDQELKSDHGISQLKMPHNAPMDGYMSKYNRQYIRKPSVIYTTDTLDSVIPRKDVNYFFRIRSKTNSKGIVSALYGKIHGPIMITDFKNNDSRASILFTYYLNPVENDTNLEFDTSKNMFENLNRKEQVNEP